MTQRFLEDGTRRARHRARGRARARSPASARTSATATRPSSSRSAPCREKHLTKAELGHLKKADAAAARAPSWSSATRPASCTVGETVTVEAFEAGDRGQGLRHLEGQGLPGHDQAPQLQPRPEVPRLAQRARPGLDRRLGHGPRACSRASAAPARWATSASPSKGLEIVELDADREPDARPRLGPRPARRHRGGAHRWLRPRSSAAPAPSTLDDAVFGARFNGPLVHESRARGARTRAAAARTRPRPAARSAAAAPSRGARRAPAAPAPARSRSPIWTGGGTVFGPQPRHYTFKVNRKARRAALRSALSHPRRARARSPCSTRPSGFDDALDQQAAASCWPTGSAPATAPCWSSSATPRSRRR